MDNIWLVVKIKNNSENKAYLNLKNQGFEVFYPRIYKNKVLQNSIKKFLKPLFPGYMFVKLSENFSKINYTFGVSKLLNLAKNLVSLTKNI